MRTHTLATLLALAATLGLSACDDENEATPTKTVEAKAPEGKDAKAVEVPEAKAPEAKAPDAPSNEDDFEDEAGTKAASETLKLDKLGLEAEAPSKTSVGDAEFGEGMMIQGPDLIAMVEVSSAERPTTEQEARKEAQGSTPRNLVTETLSDGWVLTFDNERALGPNYFVQVRREIGGKSIWCETTVSTPEQQANALALCKSLRPAGA